MGCLSSWPNGIQQNQALSLCTLGQQIANYGAGLFCCPSEGVVEMLSDQEIQKAADGHFGVLVEDSAILFPLRFLFLEAIMKQESNFCIGYRDYMTPVVTADRFKCHLRTGMERKAVF